MATTDPTQVRRIIAHNKRARFDYFIEETIEAGLCLQGSEVKSLRKNRGSIDEAYVGEQGGELYLLHSYIGEYTEAHQFNHPIHRPRKLLLHKKQINKWMGRVKMKGYTIVPVCLYFNHKNKAKIEIGLAKGKKEHDKRQSIKQREWDREKERTLKEK
ncbi:MAG: SsrA-binding protein SmpB [Alphaproteobacteria bacterium]|nr:SsrA-binding protein SmpB [Alphaproteobacteria bacterium]